MPDAILDCSVVATIEMHQVFMLFSHVLPDWLVSYMGKRSKPSCMEGVLHVCVCLCVCVCVCVCETDTQISRGL